MGTRTVSIKESTIERSFCKKLEKLGLYSIKLSPTSLRGMPDRLVLLNLGEVCFIEFKRPGKELTELQEHRASQLKSRGYECRWYDDADKAIEWIKSKL